MSLEKTKSLLDLMKEHELAELEFEEGEFKLKAKKLGVGFAPLPAPLPLAAAAPASAPAAAPVPEEGLTPIKSPIVGTFYRAPAPDAAPFVKEGDAVTSETVICIIEAMKIMNEVKAGVSGTLRRILVENGDPVEYGQPLFLVKS